MITTGLALLSDGAAAQGSTPRADPGWVGLFSDSLIGWLENENRLASLCGQTSANIAEQDECRQSMLEPRLLEIRLRRAPEAGAAPAGIIVLEARPGRGLRAFYRAEARAPATQLVPDLYDVDWGYGPYFHQTFLERRGSWFLLPAGPLPQPAWLDLGEFGDDSNVRMLQAGDIVTAPVGDLFILGVDVGSMRARLEQQADMWCEAGYPPPLSSYEEVLLTPEDLYSGSGHLRVKIKYTRGC